MHNGKIGSFQEIRRRLTRRLSDSAFNVIAGSTDSEHLFALFLDHYKRISADRPRVEEMADALTATIAEIEEITREAGVKLPSFLNLAVTDGSSAVVSRHVSSSKATANSLYVHAGTSFVCTDGHYRMVEPDKGSAVLVASEPLSEDADWTKVEENSIVLVDRNLKVHMRPLDL
jgi:predicted glutamine amidotransferase